MKCWLVYEILTYLAQCIIETAIDNFVTKLIETTERFTLVEFFNSFIKQMY